MNLNTSAIAIISSSPVCSQRDQSHYRTRYPASFFSQPAEFQLLPLKQCNLQRRANGVKCVIRKPAPKTPGKNDSPRQQPGKDSYPEDKGVTACGGITR